MHSLEQNNGCAPCSCRRPRRASVVPSAASKKASGGRSARSMPASCGAFKRRRSSDASLNTQNEVRGACARVCETAPPFNGKAEAPSVLRRGTSAIRNATQPNVDRNSVAAPQVARSEFKHEVVEPNALDCFKFLTQFGSGLCVMLKGKHYHTRPHM